MAVSDSPCERVLAAARELFYSQGIGATGVDALAERAGVSKRTLYRDFGSKDAVIAAYVERFGARGALPAEDVLADATRSGRERILGAFDNLVETIEASGWRGCPITGAALEIADVNHPARPVSAAHKARFRARVVVALDDLGVGRPADREEMAQEVALLWDGALVQAVIDRSVEPVRVARRAVARLIGPDSTPP